MARCEIRGKRVLIIRPFATLHSDTRNSQQFWPFHQSNILLMLPWNMGVSDVFTSGSLQFSVSYSHFTTLPRLFRRKRGRAPFPGFDMRRGKKWGWILNLSASGCLDRDMQIRMSSALLERRDKRSKVQNWKTKTTTRKEWKKKELRNAEVSSKSLICDADLNSLIDCYLPSKGGMFYPKKIHAGTKDENRTFNTSWKPHRLSPSTCLCLNYILNYIIYILLFNSM